MTLAHDINTCCADGRRMALVMEAALNGGGLVVCAWCKTWLRVNRDLPAGSVSHTVCTACEARLLEEMEETLPSAAALVPVHPAPASAVGFGTASPARLPVAFSECQFNPEVFNE